MLVSVENLKKKAKKASSAENSAFQQLFLLVGMHLFKVATLRLDVQTFLKLLLTTALKPAPSPGPGRAPGYHEGPAELCGQSSGEESQEEKEAK